MTPILLLMPSIRPLDTPSTIAASIPSRCLRSVRASFTEGATPRPAGPGEPGLQVPFRRSGATSVERPQFLLEQIRCVAWSVLVAPLEKEFGWKRADTSLIFTIAGSRARAAPAACVDCFRTGRCAGLPDHSVCSASDRKSVEVPDRRQGRLGRLPVTAHASVGL